MPIPVAGIHRRGSRRRRLTAYLSSWRCFHARQVRAAPATGTTSDNASWAQARSGEDRAHRATPIHGASVLGIVPF